MRAWPDADRVSAFLAEAARRRLVRIAAESATVAIGVTLFVPLVAAFGLLPRVPAIVAGALLALVIAGLRVRRRDRRHSAAALEVEQRAPECRNLLVTAEELLRGAVPASMPVRAVVFHDTARVVATLDLSRALPWRRPLAICASAAVVWAVAGVASWTVPVSVRRLVTAEASAMPTVEDLQITLTPPGYTALPPVTVRDPDRIEPLAGSRVRVSVRASAGALRLETPSAAQSLAQSPNGRFEGDFLATTDGYLALEPSSADGRAGLRRVIGLIVRPDRPPSVRLTAPARDLFLPDSRATVEVRVEADDDLALQSLRLTFTTVSGSGEAFAFTEGEAPLRLTRTTSRAWTGQGALALNAMGLSRGDMIVYRAVAVDSRPGAIPVESDAFVIEIVAPDAAIAEGFSIDDTRDKYALSQQMVILKTERLLARSASLEKEARLDQALNIAAEQRAVRAEIVFMMGGEFEDEVVEAEHETELSEGRLANDDRADLGRAVRAMSRASAQLTEVDLKSALATERVALAAMQRAFSRSRYILRTLTVRERVDDARRLTGSLAGTSRVPRAPADGTLPRRVTLLRLALSTLADLVRQPVIGAVDATAVGSLAERLLTSEPRDAAVVDLATELARAAEAIGRGRTVEARAAIDRVARRVSGLLGEPLGDAPSTSRGSEAGRLSGALADALRRGGGR